MKFPVERIIAFLFILSMLILNVIDIIEGQLNNEY